MAIHTGKEYEVAGYYQQPFWQERIFPVRFSGSITLGHDGSFKGELTEGKEDRPSEIEGFLDRIGIVLKKHYTDAPVSHFSPPLEYRGDTLNPSKGIEQEFFADKPEKRIVYRGHWNGAHIWPYGITRDELSNVLMKRVDAHLENLEEYRKGTRAKGITAGIPKHCTLYDVGLFPDIGLQWKIGAGFALAIFDIHRLVIPRTTETIEKKVDDLKGYSAFYDKSAVYGLPPEDLRAIVESYEFAEKDGLNISLDTFLYAIGSVFMVNWGFFRQSSDFKDYRGQGFTDYIDAETHSLVVRQGYSWTDEGKLIDNSGEVITDEYFQKMRERTIDAFVRSAIHHFSKENDKSKSLVIDLKEWI